MQSDWTIDMETSTHQPWPRAAASAVIFKGADVLIVERGKGGMQGLWSLPGGHVEAGERARDAALREVHEETGITADILGLVDVHDVILRHDNGSLRAHYVLSVYYGLHRSGEAKAASDARTARFVHPDELPVYNLTPRVPEIVAAARGLLDSTDAEM